MIGDNPILAARTGSQDAAPKVSASPRTSRRTRQAVKDQVTLAGSTTITAEQYELFKRQGFEIRRLEQALGECRARTDALASGNRRP